MKKYVVKYKHSYSETVHVYQSDDMTAALYKYHDITNEARIEKVILYISGKVKYKYEGR